MVDTIIRFIYDLMVGLMVNIIADFVIDRVRNH